MTTLAQYDLSLADARDFKATRVPLWLRAFSIFGLLLFSGALQRPIGGDTLQGSFQTAVVEQGNAGIAILALGYYTAVVLLLILRRKNITISRGMIPLLLLNGLAVISTAWSIDPSTTLVRSAGLSGCTIYAIFLINVFDIDEIIRQFVYAALILVFGTAILAIAAPSYAFHGNNEVFAIHSGLLKGSFAHKNSMAKVLSYLTIILATLGPLAIRNRALWVLSVLTAIYLMGLTGSAKTLATVPAGLGIGIMLLIVKSPTARTWILCMCAITWIAAESLGAVEYIFSALLNSLDRDPTLSSRTLIWAAAIPTATEMHPILGGGYEVAWNGGIGRAVRSVIGFDPGHAHNGYIMVYVELGLVGLGLVLFSLIRCIVSLIRITPNSQYHLYFYTVAWLVLFVGNNLSGSYITLPADLYWLAFLMTPVFIAHAASLAKDQNPASEESLRGNQ